jgi:hypothetical protein
MQETLIFHKIYLSKVFPNLTGYFILLDPCFLPARLRHSLPYWHGRTGGPAQECF